MDLIDESPLQPVKKEALYHALADKMMEDFELLERGAKLPSRKELLKKYKASNYTLGNALNELKARGVITTQFRKGMYVAENVSNQEDELAEPPYADYPLPSFYSLAVGPSLPLKISNIRLDLDDPYPNADLDVKLAAVKDDNITVMPVDTIRSSMELAEALIDRLHRQRGVNVRSGQLCLVQGRYRALQSVGRVLTDHPGEFIVMRRSANVNAFRMMRNAGLHVASMDAADFKQFTGEVDKIVRYHQIKGIYLEPACDYHTGECIDEASGAALLEMADRFNFPIIELDFDFEISGRAFKPLFAGDQKNVIYLSCISKTHSTLIDFTLIGGPVNVIAALRNLTNQNSFNEYKQHRKLFKLLNTSSVEEAAVRMALDYSRIRERLLKSLKRLGPSVSVIAAVSGPFIFLGFPEDTNLCLMKDILKGEGITICCGYLHYRGHRAELILRVSFACLAMEQVEFAAERLVKAYRACRPVNEYFKNFDIS